MSPNVCFVSVSRGSDARPPTKGNFRCDPSLAWPSAAATTLAVTLPLTGARQRGPEAQATRAHPGPGGPGTGRRRGQEAQSVAQIEAALAAANARLDGGRLDGRRGRCRGATTARCGSSRRPARRAGWRRPRAEQAAADVADQRAGIVSLVTESYQNGTELNTRHRAAERRGPGGLMNRYGVVQSAGDSMEARLRRASGRPRPCEDATPPKAAKAEKRQESLAAEAHEAAPTRQARRPPLPASPPTRSPRRRQQLIAGAGQGPEHLGRRWPPAGTTPSSGSPGRRRPPRPRPRRPPSRPRCRSRPREAKKDAGARQARPADLGRAATAAASAPRRSPRWLRRRRRSANPAPEPGGRGAARHRLRQGAARQALPVGAPPVRTRSTAPA